jgi:hypothetical protein
VYQKSILNYLKKSLIYRIKKLKTLINLRKGNKMIEIENVVIKIKDKLDSYDAKTIIVPYDPANFQGRRQSPDPKTTTKTVRIDKINMSDQYGPVKAESITPNINFIEKCYNFGQGMSDEGQIDSFIIPLIEGLEETPILNKIDSMSWVTGYFFCLLGFKNPKNNLFDLMWGVIGEPYNHPLISLILFEAAHIYTDNGEETNEEKDGFTAY